MKIKVVFIIFILIFAVTKLYDRFIELNMCVDMGLCAEGLTVQTPDGKLPMSKDVCEKNHWKWDETKGLCNVRVNEKD